MRDEKRTQTAMSHLLIVCFLGVIAGGLHLNESFYFRICIG